MNVEEIRGPLLLAHSRLECSPLAGLAIPRLIAERVKFKSFEIDELTVSRLHANEIVVNDLQLTEGKGLSEV